MNQPNLFLDDQFLFFLPLSNQSPTQAYEIYGILVSAFPEKKIRVAEKKSTQKKIIIKKNKNKK